MSSTAAKIEIRYRPLDTAGAWKYKTIPPSQGSVDLDNLERGVTYQIEARSVALSGAASAWVAQTHIVASTSTTPLTPTMAAAVSLADGVHLSWTVTDAQRTDTEYEVQRTGDLSGAPDPAGWADLTTVRSLAYTDGVTDGVVRWYRVRAITYLGLFSAWSSAVNSRGKIVAEASYSSPTVDNGNFESSALFPAPGWTFSAGTAYETTAPQSGARSLKYVSASAFSIGAATERKFRVTPGEIYRVVGWVKTDGACIAEIQHAFFDVSGTYLGGGAQSASATNVTAWTQVSSADIVPANAVYSQIWLQCNTAGSHTVWFDNIAVFKVYDPSTEDIATKGSIPPTLATAFTYTSATTSITWHWAGLTIYRADGTTVTPADTGFTVTGLSPNTSYLFYPYYDEALGSVQFVTIPGTGAGSPAAAFASRSNAQSQQQYLRSRIPLADGPMTAATPASGGGTGGGGGGACLWANCVVLSKDRGIVAIGSCHAGELIKGKRGKWTQIKTIRIEKCDRWIEIAIAGFADGEGIRCSVGHCFPLVNRPIAKACEMSLQDVMISCPLENISEDSSEEQGVMPESFRSFTEDSEVAYMECDHEHDETCPEQCDEGRLFYAGINAPVILTHNPVVGS